MYNNQGVFHITNDMCYENKIMNEAASAGVNEIKVAVNVDGCSSIDRTAKAKTKYKLYLSHVINGIVIAISAAFITLVEYGVIPSRKIGFFCGDPTISHKFTGDTVTNTLLGIICLLLPLIIISSVECCKYPKRLRKASSEIWKWFKEYLIGITVTLFITETFKAVAGEHRPHFLDTCAPEEAINCTKGLYIQKYTCTNKIFSNYLIVDSSRSFPSGHSSLSMFFSVFITLYLQYQIKKRVGADLMKPALLTLVLLVGPAVGLSRIVDYRHHWWDVLVGLTIGLTIAIYTLVYPCKRNRKPEITNTASMTALYCRNNSSNAQMI